MSFFSTNGGKERQKEECKVTKSNPRQKLAVSKWVLYVMDYGHKSPLSTARYVTSSQSTEMSAHSHVLIRTAIVTMLLAIVAVCLFGCVLNSQSGIFREFQMALLSVQWMLLVCLVVWCCTFLVLTFCTFWMIYR